MKILDYKVGCNKRQYENSLSLAGRLLEQAPEDVDSGFLQLLEFVYFAGYGLIVEIGHGFDLFGY